MKNSLPLLIRSPIIDGESLPSFLFRLSLLNYYDPPNLLIRLCANRERASMVARKRMSLINDAIIFARISALSGMSPLNLYETTAHVFSGLLTPPILEIDLVDLESELQIRVLKPGIADKQLRSEYAAQFCPRCLEHDPYFPLTWMPVAISGCLHHQCLLVAQCPSCNKRLSVLEIVKHQCKKCEHNLRETPVISIAEDVTGLFAQRTLQRWFRDTETIDDHPDLDFPKQPPRVLYRVVDGIRQSLQSLIPDSYVHLLPGNSEKITLRSHLNRRKLSPAESYILYTTAIKAISDWPKGFYALLDSLTNPPNDNTSSGVKSSLGVLHSNWLEGEWAHREFQFIQDAYDQYLRATPIPTSSLAQLDRYRKNPSPKDGFRYISMSDTAKTLGTTTATILRLFDGGHLKRADIHEDDSSSDCMLFYRSEVVQLRRSWESAIPLNTAMQMLGLNRTIVLELGALGELDIVRGPTVDGCRLWKLDEATVERFLRQIIKRTRTSEFVGEMISLTRAVHITANIGISAAEILRFVAHGEIDAFTRGSDGFSRLNDMQFRLNDIRDFSAKVEVKNGWVRKEEIMRRKNVSSKAVNTWIRRGLLFPAATHNNIQFFDEAQVERFCEDYLDLGEAAQLLDISAETAWKWTKRKRLMPLSGPGVDCCKMYLFHRGDIDIFRLENCLTSSQATELIGISGSQLLVWIQAGKVRPISGPGIDKTGHYLFSRHDILRLASEKEQER